MVYRCKGLDDIGDSSSYEERRCYFDEVDVDQSEGIDFEEFLQVGLWPSSVKHSLHGVSGVCTHPYMWFLDLTTADTLFDHACIHPQLLASF